MNENKKPAAMFDAASRESSGVIHLQGCGGCAECARNAATPEQQQPSFVYALGSITARFPSLGVEKEFAQATARSSVNGGTVAQTMHAVLSQVENRYLARMLCWVFSIEGLETYLLKPRDIVDLGQLIEALRPRPRATDVDVVIGVLGPLASPEMCNGLVVPIVGFDRVYSFDVDQLIKSIPRPDTVHVDQFEASAEELFQRIMQIADNAGAMDDHRALNTTASADSWIIPIG